MSKIITDTYFNKLNILIEEYKISANLTSIIDFFIDEIQTDQNNTVNKNQKVFSESDLKKLNEIKGSDELRRMFAYINIIIKTFSGQYLHIHINSDLSENIVENLTTLFAWEVFVSGSQDNVLLQNEAERIDTEIKRELNLTGIAGHIENRCRRERKGLRHKLRLINQTLKLGNPYCKNGILLNINSTTNGCVNVSEFSELPMPLNNHINFGDTLKNTFKKVGEEKVLGLSMILNLFPSITGKNIWYKDSLRDEIIRYPNFTKVITITSGEKTPEALLEIYKLKKFQAEEIYTIFSFEL